MEAKWVTSPFYREEEDAEINPIFFAQFGVLEELPDGFLLFQGFANRQLFLFLSVLDCRIRSLTDDFLCRIPIISVKA